MTSSPSVIEFLRKIVGARVYRHYPLAPLTSLKIGGQAEFFVHVNNLWELQHIVDLRVKEGIPVRVLGRGTDLLIQDGILEGIVLQLQGDFKKIEREGGSILIKAGCPISFLLREAVKGNLGGTEALAGIPGTLGGALLLNAGTTLGSISDLIQTIDILTKDADVETRTREDIKFSYRECGIGDQEIVLGAQLILKPGSGVKTAIESVLEQRWATQPWRENTAGCVFKNPVGQFAGALIDNAGLKGYRHGGIEVSKKHANFFINRGGGTTADFMYLMELVQKKVNQVFGVVLQPEVKIWMNPGTN